MEPTPKDAKLMEDARRYARTYHETIVDVTTATERLKIDAAFADGTGDEHDLMDANEQALDAWSAVFGGDLFDVDTDAEHNRRMAVLDEGTMIARTVGFANPWPARAPA